MATVTLKNIGSLTKRLNKIAEMDIQKRMVEATKVVHAEAKNLAPVDTGNLAGSIHMEVKKQGKNYQGRVFTNVTYAPFVEFGTGIKGNGTYPYKLKNITLVYKNKKWLAHIPKIGWRYVSGQVAQPYMYPALKHNEKYVRQILSQGVKEAVKGG